MADLFVKENLALQTQKSINEFKSAQEYFTIFDSMVKPILMYGSKIWGTEYSETVERVQDKFCKDYLILLHGFRGVWQASPML